MTLDQSEQYEEFHKIYADTVEPAHKRFNSFLKKIGLPEYEAGQFFGPSPTLNLLLYTQALRYERKVPLNPTLYQFLEGCVRDEGLFEIPEFPAHNDKPVVYISFGSLGAADVALFERMIRLFSTLPYRFMMNAGSYKDSYRYVPDNVHIDYWYPQPSVVKQADLFIHHGGNNSVHEALYFGVPSIVMPYCWDGHDNATRMKETGVGVHMDRYEWRDGEMIDTIEKLISNKSLRKKLKNISVTMQAEDGCSKAAKSILSLANVDTSDK